MQETQVWFLGLEDPLEKEMAAHPSILAWRISCTEEGYSLWGLKSRTWLSDWTITSAFFMVQLSQAYVTTGKIIALPIWTFVGKVMSLLFNTLSRFVIAFLPRSSGLLISWVLSPSSDFRTAKEEICHCFHLFPFYLPWSDGTGCHDLSFFNVDFQASFFTLLLHPSQEAH